MSLKNSNVNSYDSVIAYDIVKALQQTRFKMDEIGADVESAATIGFSGYSGATTYPSMVIDQPFLLWIVRDGMEIPYFVGHFNEEHWKRPDRGIDYTEEVERVIQENKMMEELENV